MKSVKLNEEQMNIVKGLAELCEAFCDQVYHIMKNHELDTVDGCSLMMYVDPRLHYSTRSILVGERNTDFGNVSLTKGLKDETYSVYGKNSPEYEWLFASPELRGILERVCSKGVQKNG